VDLWCVALATDAARMLRAERDLAPAEIAHARRMRVGGERFAVARATLRRVLGRYLGLPASCVPLARSAHGKPVLAGRPRALRFNLAHADDVALIAVRLGADVGVDIERVRADVDGDAVARAIFTPGERAAMGARNGANAHVAFFQAWVRREALAKAAGTGIVSTSRARGIAGFTVRPFAGVPGHVAAVASRGANWGVARWQEAGPFAAFEAEEAVARPTG
jgi:4'-phosphopantetheinyl transferase